MNTHLRGFPHRGYHPTHWLFGFLVSMAVSFALFHDEPWGVAMSVVSGIAVISAVLTSRAYVVTRLLIGGILGAIVVLSPLLVIADPEVMMLVWLLTTVGTAFLTVNLMYGSPGITERPVTAFLSVATAAAFGVFTVLALGDMFPPLRWIVWLVGGPLAGLLFGKFAKTEAR